MLTVNNEAFVDGVCGGCIAHENKWLENRNASVTICEDLKAFGDLDVVIVWLGTNDCKSMYGDTAKVIAGNLENLVKTIENITKAKMVLVSPVCINENTPITKKYYLGACEKSKALDTLYRELAERKGYAFVSGVDLEVGEDGEHLTLSGHKELSMRIQKIINEC